MSPRNRTYESYWLEPAQKVLGYIKDYAMHGVPYGENEFNVVLVVNFQSTDMIAPSKERCMKFREACRKTNMDRANFIALEACKTIRKNELIGE